MTEEKVTEIGHNGFNVKCKIDKWNGDPGPINIELWNSKHSVQRPCKGTSCDLNFTDLYYLTEYNIKVGVLTFDHISVCRLYTMVEWGTA